MKYLSCSLILALGAVLCFGGIGCEQHPVSESADAHGGHAEHPEPAAKPTPAAPEGANPNAPAYFPPKK